MNECELYEAARNLLDYNPVTGIFVWKISRPYLAHKNSEAGGIHNGYRRIKVFGRECLAHRLAWYFIYGSISKAQIDHINGDRSDNRICNLRLANHMQQRANSKLNKDNSSGYRGVYFNKRRGKWRAHIQRQHLGYFETKEKAAEAYNLAFDLKFGAEFRRENA